MIYELEGCFLREKDGIATPVKRSYKLDAVDELIGKTLLSYLTKADLEEEQFESPAAEGEVETVAATTEPKVQEGSATKIDEDPPESDEVKEFRKTLCDLNPEPLDEMPLTAEEVVSRFQKTSQLQDDPEASTADLLNRLLRERVRENCPMH